MKLKIAAALAVYSLSLAPATLDAALIEVTNLQDAGEGSLRAAIDLANADSDADQILFTGDAATGVLHLQSKLPAITTELSISGPGANVLTISGDSDGDGEPDVSVFSIEGRDAQVVISDLTVSHGLASDDGFWHRQRLGGGFYILRGASVRLHKVAVEHCLAKRIDRNDSYITGAGIAVVYANLVVDSCAITDNALGVDRFDKGVGAGSAIYLLGSRGNEVTLVNSTISNNVVNLKPGASSHGGAIFVTQTNFNFHPHPFPDAPRGDDDDSEGDDDDSEGDDDDSEGDDDDSEGDDDDSEGDDDDSEGDDDDSEGDDDDSDRRRGSNSGGDDDDDRHQGHRVFFGSFLDGREYDDDQYDDDDFEGEHSDDGDNDGDNGERSWHKRPRFVLTIESCTIADNRAVKGCAGLVSRNRPHKILLKNNVLARNTTLWHWRFGEWHTVKTCNFHQRGLHRRFPRTFSLGGNVFDDDSGERFLTAENDISDAEGIALGELADNDGPTLTHALGEGSVAIGNAVEGAPARDQRCLSRDDDPDSGAYESGDGGPVENTPPVLVLDLPDIGVPFGAPDQTVPLHDHFDDAEDADSALGYAVDSNSTPSVVTTGAISSADGELVLDFGGVGTTTITVSAIDTGGLSASGSFTVTVGDDEPPVITGMPGDISVPGEGESCSAVVTWELPMATDNVGVVSFMGTHQPGDTFGPGTTTVTYTAKDAAGNSASESFTITVSDQGPPVISGVPGDIKVCPEPGSDSAVVSWAEPTASDACGSATLSSTHSPGDTFGPGVTTVVYTATDEAGNMTTASFSITVVGAGDLEDDTEPPVFTGVPGHIIVNSDPGTFGAIVTWDPPTATDDVCLDSLTCTHDSGSFFCVGTTIVCCTATDHAGNSTTVCWKVTVKVGPGEMLAVATVDNAAPGAAGNYTDFTSVFLTDSGAILMEAEVGNQAGLWTADCGDLGLVALKGDAVPGGTGTIDNFIFTFMAEETEEVAFKALIAGVPLAENEAQFYFDGALSTVAQSGMTDPNTGAPILRFGGRGQSLNRVGEYFYQADLVRGGAINGNNDNVIFSNQNGIVVRDGDALPAIPGATFSNIQSTVSATKSGALGFNSFIRGAPRASNVVLVTGDPSNLQVAAREGDHAPGTPAGVSFARFLGESINENAEVAFVGQLVANAALGVTSSTDNGVWTNAKGAGLQYVVREGDEAPVLGDPAVTVEGFEDPLITDNGIVYVKVTLQGPGITAVNNDVLYAYLPGVGHQIVLHEGATAPGTGGAMVAAITSYSANGFGNLACTALLKVGVAGVTDANDEALWIYGGLGDPDLLMRKGDTFDLSPGDERIVNGLLIPTRNDAGTAGRSSAISDANIGVIVSYSAAGGGIDKGIFILGACPPHPTGF